MEALIAYTPGKRQAADLAHPPASTDVSLESMLDGKLRVFSTLIADIDAEAEKRRQLSCMVSADIQQHYSYLKTKLYETELWPVGVNRQMEHRRCSLEKQLDELDKERRTENVECWKDLAKLNVERRMWLKQYAELLNRFRIFLVSDPQGSSASTTLTKRR